VVDGIVVVERGELIGTTSVEELDPAFDHVLRAHIAILSGGSEHGT
jgi:hypothetical protein